MEIFFSPSFFLSLSLFLLRVRAAGGHVVCIQALGRRIERKDPHGSALLLRDTVYKLNVEKG